MPPPPAPSDPGAPGKTYTQVTVRLTPETKDRLMALAALRDVTAAALVEEALQDYLEKLDEEERRDVETLVTAAHLG